MRILVLTNLYPPHAIGGYEERCRRVVDGLRARGHDVRVLTSDHSAAGVVTPPSEPLVRRKLRIHGFFGHPWLPPHKLHGLERYNHSVLRGALAEFRPELVHVWNLGGLSKGLMLSLDAWGGPVVYDVSDHWIARSLRADVWQRWWAGEAGGAAARLVRGLLRVTGMAARMRREAPYAPFSRFHFRRIYFCSAALRDLTAAKGWPVSHAAVIHCGVETALYTVREPSDRFTELLYVGRLDEDKDPLTAIRALARLHASGRKELRLTLFGRGPEAYVAELKREAEQSGVAASVTFSSAPSTEMISVYARHDALVFTSAWEEPFALTPLEAMASGVPVVGTPTGGSRELFRDGENGRVFEARDVAGCARCLESLAADPALRRRIATTALTEVRERYDLEAITSEIENYLLETARSWGRDASKPPGN